jgi:predicted AAA+ superfamily ATPase
MVLTSRSGPIPIEVKYQSSIYKSDAKGLVRFCDVNDSARAFLVTRDRQGTMEVGGVAVNMLPLWRLLLST